MSKEPSRAVDLNFYLGFGGIITFKNSGALQVALDVPAERLLLETDCPFLAPTPKRGKRNEPAYVRYVAECLADAGCGNTEDVCRRTTQNAQTLFGLTTVKTKTRLGQHFLTDGVSIGKIVEAAQIEERGSGCRE